MLPKLKDWFIHVKNKMNKQTHVPETRKDK